MRTHLSLAADTGPVTSASWFIGLIVNEAGLPTTNSDLQPSTHPELGWLLWSQVFPGESAGVSGQINKQYDLKGKRKMTQMGAKLILAVQNTDSASHTLQYAARILLALP